MLVESGADPDVRLRGPNPVQAAEELYRQMLETSLSAEEAAERLGVNASRVRQRLAGKSRSLYGIKTGRAWVLPAFQFTDDGLVHGFEAVIHELPADMHPVAVYRWFSLPSPDLRLGPDEEVSVSPLDWLRSGGDPKEVMNLASQL
jgi:hypothetical protein